MIMTRKTASRFLVLLMAVAGIAMAQLVMDAVGLNPRAQDGAPAVMAGGEDDVWSTAEPWEGATPTIPSDIDDLDWEDE